MNELPDGFKPLALPKEEIDYLVRYYELPKDDHIAIFERAVKLLYDLVKCREMGWELAIAACRQEDGGRVFDSSYRRNLIVIGIDSLHPDEQGRLVRINYQDLYKFKQNNGSLPEDNIQ